MNTSDRYESLVKIAFATEESLKELRRIIANDNRQAMQILGSTIYDMVKQQFPRLSAQTSLIRMQELSMEAYVPTPWAAISEQGPEPTKIRMFRFDHYEVSFLVGYAPFPDVLVYYEVQKNER